MGENLVWSSTLDLYSDLCYLKPILQVIHLTIHAILQPKTLTVFKLVEQDSIRLFQWFLDNQMTANRINFIF